MSSKHEMPQYLYYYRSLAGERFKWFTDIILNSSLYFASRRSFNDPFDGMSRLIDNFKPEDIRARMARRMRREGKDPEDETNRLMIDGAVAYWEQEDPQKLFDHAKAQLGILCLAEAPDDIPMWAYYADAHRGVCLKFDTSRLSRWITAGEGHIEKVRYAQRLPEVSFYAPEAAKMIGYDSIFTKPRVWCHEKEWRVVVESVGPIEFPPDMLSAVILGCRVNENENDEERVRAFVSRRSPVPKLLRARQSREEYRLDIVPASESGPLG